MPNPTIVPGILSFQDIGSANLKPESGMQGLGFVNGRLVMYFTNGTFKFVNNDNWETSMLAFGRTFCSQLAQAAWPLREFTDPGTGTIANLAGLAQATSYMGTSLQLSSGGAGSILLLPSTGGAGGQSPLNGSLKGAPWMVACRCLFNSTPTATSRIYPICMPQYNAGNPAGPPAGPGGVYFGINGTVNTTKFFVRACSSGEANNTDLLSATSAPILGEFVDMCIISDGGRFLFAFGNVMFGQMTVLNDLTLSCNNPASYSALWAGGCPAAFLNDPSAACTVVLDKMQGFCGIQC